MLLDRLGLGAAAIAVVSLQFAICGCSMPSDAPAEDSAHEHGCDTGQTSPGAVHGDCCGSFPEKVRVAMKSDAFGVLLSLEPNRVALAAPTSVRIERKVDTGLISASPRLVLRI